VVGGTSSAHEIKAGRAYRFRIAARAFNGLGETSPIATIWACSSPKDLDPPDFHSVTETSMTLTWREPKNNGACPINGYSLYMDDGSSGAPVVLVSDMAIDIPSLLQHTITIDTSLLGTTYTFKL
jgi:hypothetical protein